MILHGQTPKDLLTEAAGSTLDFSVKVKTNFHLKQTNALVRQGMCDYPVEKIIEELHFSVFCTKFFRLYCDLSLNHYLFHKYLKILAF